MIAPTVLRTTYDRDVAKWQTRALAAEAALLEARKVNYAQVATVVAAIDRAARTIVAAVKPA
jgi:hypothetical protein